MGAPPLAHYVPQFLLNRFTDSSDGALHVYDKQTDRIFKTSPRNVAAERAFYDIETEWGTVTAEPGLSTLESVAATIIEKVCANGTLGGLSDGERAKLAIFFAVQFTRTRHMRENLGHVSRLMAERLRSSGINPEDVRGFKVMTDEDVKRLSMNFMVENVEEFAGLFLDKVWVLGRTSTARPLLLSDNPVALHNDRRFGLYGNLGLAVPGIEIHFPLSATLALLILCRTHETEFRKTKALVEHAKKKGFALDKKQRRARRGVLQVVAAMDTGAPFDLSEGNVVRENSLQVGSGSRFVFSSNGDFSLVTRMLSDHNAYRTGPRFDVR